LDGLPAVPNIGGKEVVRNPPDQGSNRGSTMTSLLIVLSQRDDLAGVPPAGRNEPSPCRERAAPLPVRGYAASMSLRKKGRTAVAVL